jgi:tRNA-binding protein
MTISYEDFDRVDIRLGTAVRVEAFTRAKKPAYKIWVDFGEHIGILQTSAQVTAHYTPDTLIGKRVLGCVNLSERNIAGFISQFLLLGFHDKKNNICLATTDHCPDNGERLC